MRESAVAAATEGAVNTGVRAGVVGLYRRLLGRFVRAGDTFIVDEPATGLPLAAVAASDAATAAAAVADSRRAYEQAWRGTTPREQSAYMRAVAAVIRGHAEEFAELEAREVGKPRRDALRFDLLLFGGVRLLRRPGRDARGGRSRPASGGWQQQPGAQPQVIRGVAWAARQRHLLGKEQRGGFRLDWFAGENEVNAVRGRACWQVLGAECGRAVTLEHVAEPRVSDKSREQGTVPVDVEVAAYHDRSWGSSNHAGQGG